MDTLFFVSFIITAVCGAGLLFFPAPLLGPFGVTLDATAAIFARLFGSTLISFGIILEFAHHSISVRLKQGVVFGLFTYYLVSTTLLVIARLAGLMNSLGWGLIGLHIIFMVWFGAFLFRKASRNPKRSSHRKAERVGE